VQLAGCVVTCVQTPADVERARGDVYLRRMSYFRNTNPEDRPAVGVQRLGRFVARLLLWGCVLLLLIRGVASYVASNATVVTTTRSMPATAPQSSGSAASATEGK